MVSDRFWAYGLKLVSDAFGVKLEEGRLKVWRGVMDERKVSDEDFSEAIKYIISHVKQFNSTSNLAAMVIEYIEDVKPTYIRRESAEWEGYKGLPEPKSIGELLAGFNRKVFDKTNEFKDSEARKVDETYIEFCNRCMILAIDELESRDEQIPDSYKYWKQNMMLNSY